MPNSTITESLSLDALVNYTNNKKKSAASSSLPQNTNGAKESIASEKQNTSSIQNKANTYNKKIKDAERTVYSNVDTAMAVLEKLPDFVDTGMDILTADSFHFSLSPLGLLLDLLNTIGVTDEEIKKFIVNFLVDVLPEVEIGVKAALLSNIKSIVSCSADPRIPKQLRKRTGDGFDIDFKHIFKPYDGSASDNYDRGMLIDCDSIDPEGILSYSPYSEKGMNHYFGVVGDELRLFYQTIGVENAGTGTTSVQGNVSSLNISDTSATKNKWSLCRAEDKNAFLWFAIHCARFPSPLTAIITGKTITIGETTFNDNFSKGNKTSIFAPMDLKMTSKNGGSAVSVGNSAIFKGADNEIALCVKSEIFEDENNLTADTVVTGNTFLPVSSDWKSADWYVNTSNYYTYNLGYKKKPSSSLDSYYKQKAICNIKYMQPTDYATTYVGGSTQKILFTILPKPYVYVPYINTGESLWKWKRILFDAYGNPDPNGTLSLPSEKLTSGGLPYVHDGESKDGYIKMEVGEDSDNCALYINSGTGDYFLASSSDRNAKNKNYTKHLVQCYNGLTVYEFNYDFIMGMKLFDPKVVCARLLETAANPTFNSTFSFSLNTNRDTNDYDYFGNNQAITELVRKIIETEDSELTDCFFTFDNTDYDSMLQEAEEKRYHQQPYLNDKEGNIDLTDVYQILQGYNEEGTKQEQKAIIENAITAATAKVSNSRNVYAQADSKKTRLNFTTNMLTQLTASLIESILTPKVLLLIAVNKQLMGNGGETFNTKELLNGMKGLVVGIVREIRDLIIKKMLDWVLNCLGPVAAELKTRELKEQATVYQTILRQLLSMLRRAKTYGARVNSVMQMLLSKYGESNGGKGKDYDLPTVLDDINYADILDTSNNDDKPTTNGNC